ncbi:MAG: carbonic anhydrase [Proteobacteria bacterium]|jgi:carbonic anhydrase|nr:carbonic anhydrase [Pseudomonadota bacterium]
MITIDKRMLLENKAWVKEKKSEDPEFFKRLALGQKPKVLWIGCADSRMPVNDMTNTQPGELFVHRNIANIVAPEDPNSASVIQYAVDYLKIEHIIVCGHTSCGGVKASMDNKVFESMEAPLQDWLKPLRELVHMHNLELEEIKDEEHRASHLARLGVLHHVTTLSNIPFIKNHWAKGFPLTIHGWILNLDKGMLEEISVISTVTKNFLSTEDQTQQTST